MKCPKDNCGGAMYRFRPKHLVEACYRTDTGVLMDLRESQWRQIGLVCGSCGYMEFYTENPAEVFAYDERFFERTEA